MDGNAAESTWEWNPESFTFDPESPLALSDSLSLWEEWTRSEAETKQIFTPTPSSVTADLRSPTLPTVQDDTMSEGQTNTDPNNLEDSPYCKRRRMLFCKGDSSNNYGSSSTSTTTTTTTTTTSTSTLIQNSLGDNYDYSLQLHEGTQTPDSSSDVSLWLSANVSMEETCNDNEGQDNWLLCCINEGEDSHLVSNEHTQYPSLPAIPTAGSEQSTSPVDVKISNGNRQHASDNAQKRVKPTIPLVYPFAVVKPSGVEGDMTLKEINQRILMAPTRPIQHPVGDHAKPSSSLSSGSGLSGKALVSCTKIHTEGKGSITILRTKG